MSEHDDLVRSLLVERYARNDWWTRQPSQPAAPVDDEVTCARRRRELVQASEQLEETA